MEAGRWFRGGASIFQRLKTVFDPFQLPDWGDFGNYFPADESKGQWPIITGVAGVGQVVAGKPAMSLRDLDT